MPVYPILEFPFFRHYYLNIIADSACSMKAADYMRAYQGVVADCEGLIVILRWLNC